MFDFSLDSMSFLASLQEEEVVVNGKRLQIINHNFTFIRNPLMDSILKTNTRSHGYITFDSQERVLLTDHPDAVLVGVWTTGVDISNAFLNSRLPPYLESILEDFVKLEARKATFSKNRVSFLYIPFLGGLQPPILLVDCGEGKFKHQMKNSSRIEESIALEMNKENVNKENKEMKSSKKQHNLRLWENFISRNSIKEVDPLDSIQDQLSQLATDYRNLHQMATLLSRKEDTHTLNTSFSEAESTQHNFQNFQNFQKLLHQSSQKLFTNRSYLQSVQKQKRTENSHKSHEKLLSIGQLSKRESSIYHFN